MSGKILMPVDLSESLVDIKLRSSFISRLGGEEIILIHVLNPGLGGKDHASSRLTHFSDELNSIGIKARSSLCSGHYASEIAKAGVNEKSDFIYMPASKKGFLASTFMGSTTLDVLRLSEVPVFVHKQRPELDKTEDIKKVIFATDFLQAAERAWPWISMLGVFIPELIILHVGIRASDPQAEQLRREHVQNRLEELAEKFKDDYRQITHLSRIGSPARHIVNATESENADLAVLGRLNEPFPSMILGSTCSRVASGVQCSILLVP